MEQQSLKILGQIEFAIFELADAVKAIGERDDVRVVKCVGYAQGSLINAKLLLVQKIEEQGSE